MEKIRKIRSRRATLLPEPRSPRQLSTILIFLPKSAQKILAICEVINFLIFHSLFRQIGRKTFRFKGLRP